jgi:hypothetical protein
MNKIAKTKKSEDNDKLQVVQKDGQSAAQAIANAAQSAALNNAITHRNFAKDFGEINLTASCEAMREKAAKVQSGDLSELEETLITQTVTLNAIFNTMARRAALNMGEHLQATETYMRMALKAQAQSRATMETLAEIKYPKSPTFVKQQNNAYQQQVNNSDPEHFKASTRTHAHGNSNYSANELLNEASHEKMDCRGTCKASSIDRDLEAVAEINRSKNTKRQKG